MLRHLTIKRQMDDETKDMVAAIILALRDIEQTTELTTDAWEKRNYFLKADRFRLEWEWVGPIADELQNLAVEERWDSLPIALAKLLPRFADVRIAKMTRGPDTWRSAYDLLLSEVKDAQSL